MSFRIFYLFKKQEFKLNKESKYLAQFASFGFHQYQDFYSKCDRGLKFGRRLPLPFLYFSTDDLFIAELLWMNKWKFWLLSFLKGNVSLVHLTQIQGSLLLPLMCWNSRKFRWLHLECIHELQKSHDIKDSLLSSIIFSHISHK